MKKLIADILDILMLPTQYRMIAQLRYRGWKIVFVEHNGMVIGFGIRDPWWYRLLFRNPLVTLAHTKDSIFGTESPLLAAMRAVDEAIREAIDNGRYSAYPRNQLC